MNNDELAEFIASQLRTYFEYQTKQEKLKKRTKRYKKLTKYIFIFGMIYSILSSSNSGKFFLSDPKAIKKAIEWDTYSNGTKYKIALEDFIKNIEANEKLTKEQKGTLLEETLNIFDEYIEYFDLETYINACYGVRNLSISYCSKEDLKKYSKEGTVVYGTYSSKSNRIRICDDTYLKHELLHTYHENGIFTYYQKLLKDQITFEEAYASVMSDNGYQDINSAMYLLKQLVDKDTIAKALIQNNPNLIFDTISKTYSKEIASTLKNSLVIIYEEEYNKNVKTDPYKLSTARTRFINTFKEAYRIKYPDLEEYPAIVDILIDSFYFNNIYFESLICTNSLVSDTYYLTDELTIIEGEDDFLSLNDLIIKKVTQRRILYPHFYYAKHLIFEKEGITEEDPDNQIFYNILKELFPDRELKIFLTKTVNNKLDGESIYYIYDAKRNTEFNRLLRIKKDGTVY